MESMSIGQYRSHDPPKNFAVRVKFCKVQPTLGIPSVAQRTRSILKDKPEDDAEEVDAFELEEKNIDELENEEIVVRWQEKLFSEREFEYYADPMNCLTSLEKKYHEDINNIRSTLGDRTNKRVFTYVDADNACLAEEVNPVTVNDDGKPTPLLEKMCAGKQRNPPTTRRPFNTGLRRRNIVVEKPTDAMQWNHVLTTGFKRMQIMADVGHKARTEDGQTGEYYYDERILCVIKMDANGLVVTEPDILEVNSKVRRVEVWHHTRSVFEYHMHDCSVQITTLQKGQEASLYNELYTRHAQLMQVHVGNELSPIPRTNEVFLFSFCEIVCARKFEYSNLYVQYYLELPAQWKSLSPQLLFGVTQSCAMNEDDIAHFSFPMDFQLMYSWPENHPDDFICWPTLYLQVYSLDSWQRQRIEGYGYCQLPDVAGSTTVQVNTWRPRDGSSFSDMRRFFVGGTRELKDLSYVKNPGDNEDSKLSKFYFETVSAGNVVLRMNTMIQSKIIGAGDSAQSKWRKAIKKAGAYSTATDSLSQVMDAFHRARKRMLAARAALPIMTG